MRKRDNKKVVGVLTAILLTVAMLVGCSQSAGEGKVKDEKLSSNIIITETGEVIKREETVKSNEPIDMETENEVEGDKTQAVSDKQRKRANIFPEIEISEPEQIITQEDQTVPTGSDLQLVFLGDSIFDSNRDGTGIPYLTAKQCDADVFNLSVGGTCAALQPDESLEPQQWDSWSLLEMVNVLMGEIPASHFDGTRAGEILTESDIDFTQTDYFIVEYGTNDFLSGFRRNSNGDLHDLKCYSGALRYAVKNLKELAPDATVILCSPCFAQFYGKGGYMVGDGNMMDKGYGSLFDYKGTCEYVAKEQGALFLNAYEDLGVDSYTIDDYTEDGLHFSSEGRKIYADALAKMILNFEETKNN